jgi:hypothetical protein
MSEPTAHALRFAARVEQLRRKARGLPPPDVAPPPPEGAARAAAAPPLVDALTAQAEIAAALSGRFDPEGLFESSVDRATRVAVLNRLRLVCFVEAEGGVTSWMLRADRRTEILRRLIAEERLAQCLKVPLPATDRFGDMLREVLARGGGIDVDRLSRDEMLAMAGVLEATADVKMATPDAARLRQRLAASRFLANYTVLLQPAFVGRTDELRRLRDFVTAPPATPRTTTWDGAVLTGLGGSGKSTLLAKLAHDIVDGSAATLVILDFDRPGIDPNDAYWLEMEMARQVGRQHPALSDRLRTLRQETRKEKVETEDDAEAYAAESLDAARGTRSVVTEMGRALLDAGVTDRPFLLVLDTFEEVTQRDLGGRLIDWIYEIADRLLPMPLKVIFSGRLFDSSRQLLTSSGVELVVTVDELEPVLARQLLVAQDISSDWADRLSSSDILPRRPLELKLLARLVKEGAAASVDELEQELRRGGPAARELFAGLVYRRVLRRIRDDSVRALAYPGLVLRYMNREVISEVLVPALNLPAMSGEEIDRTLDALATYDWLAYRGANQELWHRKDLRRSVLKAMIAKTPDAAKRIHQRAIEHFGRSTAERDRAERIYHQLMSSESRSELDVFDLEDLKKAHEYIGADSVDLPPAAAVLMQYAIGKELPAADVPLLPDSHIEDGYDATGRLKTESREFSVALQLYHKVRGQGALPAESALNPWEVETLFATAEWPRLEDSARRKRSHTAFRAVADLVFPDAVIGATRVDRAALDVVLEHAADEQLARSAERQTLLNRLTVGLVLLDGVEALSRRARHAIDVLNNRIRKAERRPSALVERRQVLLDLIANTPRERRAIGFTARISPLTLRLNPAWLERFESLFRMVPPKDRPRLESLFASVQAILKSGAGGRSSVRTTLGAVNALSSATAARTDVRVVVRPRTLVPRDRWDLMCGPDPEFRDPSRFALLEAFPDAAGRRRLGELFSANIPLALDDLSPAAFAESTALNPEHALESYVELADRCGVLHTLMQAASREQPDAAKLLRVTQAYGRWTDAVHDLFLSPPL